MSPIATPPPLYTKGSVKTFSESSVVMVFANVTPVCAGVRSLKSGVRADRRPQLIMATIGTSVAIARSESRNMGPQNLTLPVGGGYHSLHAKTRCLLSRVRRADRLPRSASVRRRAPRAGVLCRLPHVSRAGAAGQANLARGRLTADGPAPGRTGAVVVRRNASGSGDGRPHQGGVPTGLGKDRGVLSRACSRHVAATDAAGRTAARSPVVCDGPVHSEIGRASCRERV